MPGASRLGDKANVPSDGHGCPGCPHNATGPAVAGSPNVNVNGKPAVRVGDAGVHSSCCGGNSWVAQKGAPTVFVNGKAVMRSGDGVQHCGGVGKMIEGSGNVIVGNSGGGGSGSSSTSSATASSATSATAAGQGSASAGQDSSVSQSGSSALASSDPQATPTDVSADTAPAPSTALATPPPPTEWVGVKVLDEQGEPLAGATVRILRGESVVATATVGDSGHLRVDGLTLTGSYKIEVVDRPVDFAEESAAPKERTPPDEIAENEEDANSEHRC